MSLVCKITNFWGNNANHSIKYTLFNILAFLYILIPPAGGIAEGILFIYAFIYIVILNIYSYTVPSLIPFLQYGQIIMPKE